MEKTVCLNRHIAQLHVWEDNELIASYWGVVGLEKNDTGERWNVKAKWGGKKRTIGSVAMLNARITEKWQ